MEPVSRAPKRYLVEFGIAVLLYVSAVYGRSVLAAGTQAETLHVAIILSPILPIFLMAAAVHRLYRRMDELQRLRLLEALAFSAGGTAVFVTSWGFLQDVGFPPLPLYAAWLAMAVLWILAAALAAWRDAASEGKAGALIVRVLLTIMLVGVGTAAYVGVAAAVGWSTSAGVVILVATAFYFAVIGFWTFSRKGASC